MSTTISFVAEPAFSKKIEEIVKKTGMYQSKSEYVRAAVREKLQRDNNPPYSEEDLAAVRQMRANLQKKMKFQGYPSQEERDKWATEYLNSLKEK